MQNYDNVQGWCLRLRCKAVCLCASDKEGNQGETESQER